MHLARPPASPRGARGYRLPTDVAPREYDLTLAPDLPGARFSGRETVLVEVRRATATVVLNAVEIEIHEAIAEDAGGALLRGRVSLDAEAERATIRFPRKLTPGEWRLSLRFTGILNDKLAGFYLSRYKDAAGSQKVMATTQMEATDARRAFPCWDEPELKAVFRITLEVEPGLAAVSNATVASETIGPASGKKVVRFASTIKMPTYLVAFVVGDMEATDPVDVRGTPVRVWCVPGKRHLADFALQAAAHALAYFEDYYGIPYVGGKLDLLAIPDFAAGAMENMGAVTFRETLLLVDEKAASHGELERVADVVDHELAHMWFGDLVTMRWWNGIWLNEAFATFMGTAAVNDFKPEWKRWESFSVARAAALQIDALHASRSIEVPVRHPNDARAMFDILTYEKGASILRMLEQYLTPPAFARGIRMYLQQHQYASTETTDLWDALEEASGEPVRHMMDGWVYRAGYPMVSARRGPDGSSLELSQRQFFSLNEGRARRSRWDVPLMLRAKTTAGEVRRRVILKDGSQRLQLPGSVEWAVLNDGGHGFYRCRYDSRLLRGLTSQLQSDLGTVERFNLVSDTWASTVAGLTPVADFLDMARLFRDETDPNVWAALIGPLAYLNRVVPGSALADLQALVRDLLASRKQALGWEPAEGEEALVRQLRGSILSTLGTLGEDTATQAEAQGCYLRWLADSAAVDANVVTAVIGILAYAGDAQRYEEFFSHYKSAPTPQEENRFLYSLAAFRRPELLSRTLQAALTDEVRTQNAPYLVARVMYNKEGGTLAWEFVKANWERMMERYPENSITRMCEGVTGLVSSELQDDVVAFFATHKVPQAGKTIDQHIERLRTAVRFRQREAQNLERYLSSASRS